LLINIQLGTEHLESETDFTSFSRTKYVDNLGELLPVTCRS